MEQPKRAATLYLIPTTLGDIAPSAVLAPPVIDVIARLQYFVVESPKRARQFLQQAGTAMALQSLHMSVLDEHTRRESFAALLQPLLEGHDVGLLSDAGCPAIADPGAALVRLAHAHGLRVAPLVGPSALLLALMAAGMNGQQFAFHGYLPVQAQQRSQRLRELERESRERRSTQLFIETPYRNRHMLETMLQVCAPSTLIG